MMANTLDGICPEGSILNGLDDLPRSATRKEWFLITRRIIQDTIVTLNLDHAAEAEVIEAFTCAWLLIGMFGQPEILVDPYTEFAKGTVGVRALQSIDMTVRHAESLVARQDAIA